MKHEIEIPEGYEFDNIAYGLFGDNVGLMYVNLKKKQQKDFAFFVDEYLYDNGSTCEKISNWIGETSLDHMKSCLKTNKFSLVPWEIKIGLFRFICEDRGLDIIAVVNRIVNIGVNDVINRDFFPEEFINDLFKTK